MAPYREKPIVIEASQWWKNGDHPEDACYHIQQGIPEEPLSEGKVVRYYRHPNLNESSLCGECGKSHYEHGWIETREGGHIVCPGDWIITGIMQEHYPCKPEIFAATYEAVDGTSPVHQS